MRSDWIQEQPYVTLEDAHLWRGQDFPHEWRAHWGVEADVCPEHLDPDEWETAREVHALARQIVDAVVRFGTTGLPEHLRTLPEVLAEEGSAAFRDRYELIRSLKDSRTPEELASEAMKQVLWFLQWETRPEAKARLFEAAIQIHAYPHYGCSPGEIGARVTELTGFLLRTSGERTRQYLQRVATCYIRDMPAEMAVMARAVMESALEFDEVDHRVEENLGKGSGRPGAGLAARILAAYEIGVLDDHAREAADFVKHVGDDAIHNVPQQVPDSMEILEKLTQVLARIERYRKGNP